jgi:hypothetical protein
MEMPLHNANGPSGQCELQNDICMDHGPWTM